MPLTQTKTKISATAILLSTFISIVGVIALSLTWAAILLVENQPIYSYVNSNINSAVNIKLENNEPLAIPNSYIVKYIGTPLAITKVDLDEQFKQKLITEQQLNEKLFLAKQKISNQRQKIFNAVLDKISTHRNNFERAKLSQEIIEHSFNDLIFGDVLNISKSEAELIKKIDGIEKVSPNYIIYGGLLQSTPLIGADIINTFDNLGATCTISNKQCLDGTGIKIAFIDSGINYYHDAFGNCTTFSNCAKIADGYDYVNDDNDPIDDNGHGTHIAGIAAGNDEQVKGVAPNAKLLVYKILNNVLQGNIADAITALERAKTNGANVVNMSIVYKGNPDDDISVAVDNAVKSGIVVVACAGNSGPGSNNILCRHNLDGSINSICSPGTAKLAITVGASYKQSYLNLNFGPDHSPKIDQIAYFSSRGPVNWAGGSIHKPDIIAPGVVICSAKSQSAIGPCQDYSESGFNDTDYVAKNGTSMAAPMVAGAAALLLQKYPDWTPQQIKDRLINTTVDNPNQPVDTEGAGRLDIAKAVGPLFRRGDVKIELSNYHMNIVDSITILLYLFKNGSAPLCLDSADIDDDGRLNVGDAIQILMFMFLNGDEPSPPFSECGIDITPDRLNCEEFIPCE